MLISFEGIDGCGKSTHISKLVTYLAESGYETHVFREPGGTPVSERIRDMLLNSKDDIHPLAETLLFSAARAQLVATRIRPLLEKGAIVILDRFYDSTTAYQGFGRQILPIPDIEQLNRLATQHLEPDLTIYLKLDPETAAGRRMRVRREDRMERAGPEFFRRVSAGFDALAAREQRVIALDSSRSPAETFREIIALLEGKLPRL